MNKQKKLATLALVLSLSISAQTFAGGGAKPPPNQERVTTTWIQWMVGLVK